MADPGRPHPHHHPNRLRNVDTPTPPRTNAGTLSSQLQKGTELCVEPCGRVRERRGVRARGEQGPRDGGHDAVRARGEGTGDVAGSGTLGAHAGGQEQCLRGGQVKRRFDRRGTDHGAHGADPALRSDDGRSALEMAAERAEVVAALRT